LEKHQPIQADSVIQLLAASQLGGGELVAIDLAAALVDTFTGMRVWTPSVGAAFDESEARGLKTKFVPYLRILSDRYGARVQAFLQTWYALAKVRPSIVHAHSPYAYRAISFFQRLLRFRSIVHLHLETDSKALSWCFKTPPDMVVACAEFLVPSIQTALRAVHADKTKVVVRRNSVDTRRFIPGDRLSARQSLAMNPDSKILLMLANLSPHKGQATAIRAVRLLRDRGIPAEGYFAGIDREGAGYQEALRRLAQSLEVEPWVHFLGFRRDTERLLQAADFFILPSEHEGLPLSILEAQAAKIPVLAAPTAGVPEAVQDGNTGYLIPASDAEGYAHTVAKLCESAEHARPVIDRAYEKVQAEYSRASYHRAVSDLYRGYLERG
jgi:glycosyltransferase involved in cell wall biosynthesis